MIPSSTAAGGDTIILESNTHTSGEGAEPDTTKKTEASASQVHQSARTTPKSQVVPTFQGNTNSQEIEKALETMRETRKDIPMLKEIRVMIIKEPPTTPPPPTTTTLRIYQKPQ